MGQDSFQTLMGQFTQDQTPRVWSLLVTVFGDLTQGQGAQISSGVLGQLCPLMGVKPEAMRVALHRLRKDGWIQSQRQGRSSSYALTDWGRSQSAQASPVIYNLRPLPREAWLVVTDPNTPARGAADAGVWLTSNLQITSVRPARPTAFVTQLSPEHPLPQWMMDRICPPEFVAQMARFHDRLTQLDHALAPLDQLDCFQTSALRILIVDGWRRIVLKTPHLPSFVFPASWAADACRTRVDDLLARYDKQPIDVLEQACS